MRDGQVVEGELIAVKENSLLILETKSGADFTITNSDLSIITIVKKSKALLGGGIGFLAGAGIGALIGYSIHDTYMATASESTVFGAVGGAVLGLSAGAVIGAIVGADKTIQIEGRTELEISKEMDILREKARIPDFK